MDARQIALVQDSFGRVVPMPDAVAARFYTRLFRTAPDVRPLFHGSMIEQGRKLVLTLSMIVASLDRMDGMLPSMRELAARHVRYGIRPDHYDVMGTALMETLRDMLGADFDHETETAWKTAYSMIAATMIEASRRAA